MSVEESSLTGEATAEEPELENHLEAANSDELQEPSDVELEDVEFLIKRPPHQRPLERNFSQMSDFLGEDAEDEELETPAPKDDDVQPVVGTPLDSHNGEYGAKQGTTTPHSPRKPFLGTALGKCNIFFVVQSGGPAHVVSVNVS